MPDLKQTLEIMGWAMRIIMPQGLLSADAEELPWMFVQGMIYDDSPALGARKDKIVMLYEITSFHPENGPTSLEHIMQYGLLY